MGTQPRSGAGRRASCAVLLCCLWAIVLPAAARAENPGFGKSIIRVESIQTPQGPVTWQVKGESSVKNLPSDTTDLRLTVVIQMRTSSTAGWADLAMILTARTPAKDGTAKIDTGFIDLASAPASGNQYRIKLSGSYTVSGPPRQTINLADGESEPQTPVLPAAARAADPGFSESITIVQSTQVPGGPVTWQVKGESSVKNLPSDTTTVKVTVVIQKRTSRTAAWTDLTTLVLTTPAYDGTAKIDSRFQGLATAPASGNQYRIKLSGSYTSGPSRKTTNLADAESVPNTPPVRPGSLEARPRT